MTRKDGNVTTLHPDICPKTGDSHNFEDAPAAVDASMKCDDCGRLLPTDDDELNPYELDLCWRALGFWLSDYPHDAKANARLAKLRDKLIKMGGNQA